jgi:transcriptional regulator with XRE-family HTH domain
VLERLGIKQRTLAKELGIAESVVSACLKGDRYPKVEHLAKIAEIGNVTIDWLVTGKDPPVRYADNSTADFDRRIVISETGNAYARLNLDEEKLLRAFRQLRSADKQKVLEFAEVYVIANESRRNEGGGSSSAEGNCA